MTGEGVLVERSNLQQEMKAVRFHEYGGPEVLSLDTIPLPQIRPGEALVRVRAAALNFGDTIAQSGRLVQVPLPHILGADIAGVVTQVSGIGADELLVGKKVLVYPVLACFHCRYCIEGSHNLCVTQRVIGKDADGGFAEYVVVPVKNLVQMPLNLSFQEAASLPVSFLSAYHMLATRARLKRDETVLVLAAGSGVGIAAIQLANLFGAKVIAAASTEEKLKRARALGADSTINYEHSDLVEEVMTRTNGRMVDIVIDPLGQKTFNKSLSCLAKNGRLVACGVASGNSTTVNIRDIYASQREIVGSWLGTMSDFLEVVRLASERRLRPVIDSMYPLADAQKAQRRLLSRKAFGKIVLVP